MRQRPPRGHKKRRPLVRRNLAYVYPHPYNPYTMWPGVRSPMNLPHRPPLKEGDIAQCYCCHCYCYRVTLSPMFGYSVVNVANFSTYSKRPTDLNKQNSTKKSLLPMLKNNNSALPIVKNKNLQTFSATNLKKLNS